MHHVLTIKCGLLLLLTQGILSHLSAADPPMFVVRGPVIIAFHDPVTQKQLENNDELNTELSDFQIYATEAREPLRKAGISFQEVYARSFRVRLGSKVTTVHSGDGTGYYFIAPGKKPRVEYGVMTHPDLFRIAHEYFSIPIDEGI